MTISNEVLTPIIVIVGGVIGILLKITGNYLSSLIAEVKEIKNDLRAVMGELGIAVNDIATLKTEVNTLRDRADSTDEFKTTIFKDYQLQKR